MRTYALLKNNLVVSIQQLSEDEYRELSLKYQIIVDIEDENPRPEINWSLSGNRLVPFAPLDAAVSVKKNIIEPMAEFSKDLMNQLAAENIVMGITSANKTLECLAFFEKKVLLPGYTVEISLKNSLDTASLTVTIKLLNYFISKPEEYASLAPFITADRLSYYRDKIINKLSSL